MKVRLYAIVYPGLTPDMVVVTTNPTVPYGQAKLYSFDVEFPPEVEHIGEVKAVATEPPPEA